MKKLLSLILSAMLLFSLTACSDNESMYIKESEFSSETLEIISLFDGDLQFFDLKVDDSVKSYTVSVHNFEDGNWVVTGNMYGNFTSDEVRLGVLLNYDNCTIFLMDDSGYSSYYQEDLNTDFSSSLSIGGAILSTQQSLELNKETAVMLSIGSLSDSMSIYEISEDFRSRYTDINTGLVVTITLSEEEV